MHELLRSPRFESLLHEARDQYDFVVLDTPPLVPVCDAAVLSRLVDGMLIVVAAHETPRKLLEEALNLIDESKVLGIVFNGDDSSPVRTVRRVLPAIALAHASAARPTSPHRAAILQLRTYRDSNGEPL